jgi:AmiR/NasT family two-component response regulator
METTRILVVEDEAIVSRDISRRLQALGYEPVGQEINGWEALALARELRPELVLMDIRLKGNMDGIETAEEIHGKYRIPVIFLTACSEDGTFARAKLAEPFGYIIKPFDDRDLKFSIEMAMQRHRAEKKIRRMNRLHDVLSQLNQAIVRVRSEGELLPAVCRLVVERGETDFAYISRLEPESMRTHPVVHFGGRAELMREVRFHNGGEPTGADHPGSAPVRGEPFICNDCSTGDPRFALEKMPFHPEFTSRGSFPLT